MGRRRKPGGLAYRLHKDCQNPECGKKFSTNRSNKEHCSPGCQHRAWTLKNPRINLEALALLNAKKEEK